MNEPELSVKIVDALGKPRTIHLWFTEGEDDAINMEYVLDYYGTEQHHSCLMIKGNDIFFRHANQSRWRKWNSTYNDKLIEEINAHISKKIEESFNE